MWFVEWALKVVWDVGRWGPLEVQGFPRILKHSAGLFCSRHPPPTHSHLHCSCLRLLGRFSTLSDKLDLLSWAGLKAFTFTFPLKVSHWQLLLDSWVKSTWRKRVSPSSVLVTLLSVLQRLSLMCVSQGQLRRSRQTTDRQVGLLTMHVQS